jgi:hypothetical protein
MRYFVLALVVFRAEGAHELGAESAAETSPLGTGPFGSRRALGDSSAKGRRLVRADPRAARRAFNAAMKNCGGRIL